jgi:hypothetical protein
MPSRAKGVCLFSFIVPELELGNIQRKILFADIVKRAESAALEITARIEITRPHTWPSAP